MRQRWGLVKTSGVPGEDGVRGEAGIEVDVGEDPEGGPHVQGLGKEQDGRTSLIVELNGEALLSGRR